jgi:SAM-dependent methyltransferase
MICQNNTIFDMRRQYNNIWTEQLQVGRYDSGDAAASITMIEMSGLVTQGKRLLELGCGDGTIAQYLYDQGHNIAASDLALPALLAVQQRCPGLKVFCATGTRLPYDDHTLDIVMSFDVVEHLPDIDAHFAEVWRVLKPGGVYLFHTPNIFTNAIHETIKCRGFAWRRYHCSLQSAWGLRRRLHRHGFTNLQWLHIPPVTEARLDRVAPVVRWLLRRIPWNSLPIWMHTNFHLIAQKEDYIVT